MDFRDFNEFPEKWILSQNRVLKPLMMVPAGFSCWVFLLGFLLGFPLSYWCRAGLSGELLHTIGTRFFFLLFADFRDFGDSEGGFS